MDLAKKFEEAMSCKTVNINTLEINHKYPITGAKRITNKFGPTILLTIRDSQSDTVQVFLPKRYSAVFSDDDMDKINTNAVSLNLVYRGICAASKSYLLAIET